MNSLAMDLFLDSSPGELVELPHAGSALEHPLVFDRVARDIQRLAADGRLEVVRQTVTTEGDGSLIQDLQFRRLL
ncbi:hypothetical protein [Roseateles chitosanitabidus]|jgi:hypothetical protein|uniref:hypothetical protein n=1 Tax=Roseateles chitosanitabidus TaxID=65048 RepID=UPI0011DF7E1A|nr:hypothetical protein [Roseateles chitosanitabidus]MBO9687462.1 hypothetical protein [Roseateles chitosanitabidus]